MLRSSAGGALSMVGSGFKTSWEAIVANAIDIAHTQCDPDRSEVIANFGACTDNAQRLIHGPTAIYDFAAWLNPEPGERR